MPQVTDVPVITLNNGVAIPQLGFGTWQIPEEDTQGIVEHAIATGYRHIDTAAAYQNEAQVGAALQASGVPRDELFVTTKLWNANHGRDKTLKAFDVSMEKLGLDVLDLYLIHWPLPDQDDYVETWKALEELLESGRTRAIGVSNFQRPHLERLFAESDVVPAVNQIELHPLLTQVDLKAFHAEKDIHTEAWSPLAQGGDLLKDDTIAGIAERVGKSPAQTILRWQLQEGNIIFPKSVTASRVEENFDVFDFELTPEDLAQITGLNQDERQGPDPDTFHVT
ncbi:aldo/keto reductase [Patulibacter minatonensis]|uniref:aldo/keto reductase n=1 Tax=Patulibacter minatonensis TaxID=298163 RepID=UPI000479410D|nr:aldo/keto reductase [Patulibacter minatonensis]